MKAIPCHVVTGPLGAGKTSCIQNLLLSGTGRERVGMVVNDFGQAGLDAEILKTGSAMSAGGMEIINLPGGCLCCSGMLQLGDALQQLIGNEHCDRIIIEPSGMAIASDLVPYLRRLCEELGLELRPVIALINPRRVRESHYSQLPFFAGLINHADIIVANRVDLCNSRDLDHFREWTAKLRPPKLQIIETTYGRLPRSVLELQKSSQQPSAEAESSLVFRPVVGRKHRHGDTRADGWTEGGDGLRPVDPKQILRLLDEWNRSPEPVFEMLRIKGIFLTTDGWQLMEIADGAVCHRQVENKTEERVDWIARGELSDATIRAAIDACRVHP